MKEPKAVTIQPDMLLGAKALGKRGHDAYILALVAYGAWDEHPDCYLQFMETGEIPKGAPKWLSDYISNIKRIDKSTEARNKSVKMNNAKYHKDAPQGDSTRTLHKDAPQGDSSVAERSVALRNGAQRCVRMEEPDEGKVFFDLSDNQHKTRLDALVAAYEARTGKSDFGVFMDKVMDGRCEGCDGACVASCYETLREALVNWDGSKAKSPVPLARKMMGEEVFS